MSIRQRARRDRPATGSIGGRGGERVIPLDVTAIFIEGTAEYIPEAFSR